MEASFVDLRKKSAEIISALKRRERVTVLYRGKPAAIMEPISAIDSNGISKSAEHPAFGLWANDAQRQTVPDQLQEIRRRRYDDL